MAPLPHTQRALQVQGSGKYEVSNCTAIPPLAPTGVLVKTVAVAVNPVDAKMVDYSATAGCIGGFDFAGFVVAIGSDVKRNLKIGDRVCGLVHGCNANGPAIGAFCEYVAAESTFLLIIPDNLSFEDAAGFGISIASVGMALYQSLGLPFPGAQETHAGEKYALVYGGSSSCGTLAIQMLVLSGYTVVTTCSPKNFPLVKSRGATAMFDYRSPTCASDIRSYTNDSLQVALDCITDATTMQICYESIGKQGGKYTSLDPFPMKMHTRTDIKPHWIFVVTMFGAPLTMKGPFKRRARPQDGMFQAEWFKRAQVLLNRGQIIPHPVVSRTGGLEALVDGIDEVRIGSVSGGKLIYNIL